MTIIIDRPNGISLFQLMAAMSAIKLEKLGLKHSRGSVRKHWALHCGLGANAKHDVVLAAMQKKVDELKQAGDLGIKQV